MFSGPSESGLPQLLRSLGFEVVCYDTANDPITQDLSSIEVTASIVESVIYSYNLEVNYGSLLRERPRLCQREPSGHRAAPASLWTVLKAYPLRVGVQTHDTPIRVSMALSKRSE